MHILPATPSSTRLMEILWKLSSIDRSSPSNQHLTAQAVPVMILCAVIMTVNQNINELMLFMGSGKDFPCLGSKTLKIEHSGMMSNDTII